MTRQNLYILITVILLLLLFNGQSLLPFSKQMFEFHDMSQPARIQEFSFNIQNFKIPPRIAPHWSYGLSFPVFNFYAPFSYWITSTFNLFHISVADSLKLSFLLAILTGFLSMSFFAGIFFGFIAGLIGGLLYITSPYVATEIFVRGNIGEVWFIGLFPLALYLLYRNNQKKTRLIFISTIVTLSALLTVHNIFSIISLPLLLLIILLLPQKKNNILALCFAIGLASYFLIPAVLEMHYTYAQKIAAQTDYKDHFLCLSQLWYSPWGQGGSTKGCLADGMSFMIGKIHILVGLSGILLFIITLIKTKTSILKSKLIIFILLLTLGSTFLTLYESQPIWSLFASILKLFQFPWRLLIFVIFGIAFFGSYLWSRFNILQKPILVSIFTIAILVNTSKFFTKIQLPIDDYNRRYLSPEFIKNEVAYRVPEYLPTTVNYDYWKELNQNKNLLETANWPSTPFQTLDGERVETVHTTFFDSKIISNSNKFLINIHYFPAWKIYINNQEYIPNNFDKLGRPLITTPTERNTVSLVYTQTLVEILANFLSILSICSLAILLIHPMTIRLLKKYDMLE